ncbi:MAG: condensation domain-containing protein [Kibdelosporangium sp.]
MTTRQDIAIVGIGLRLPGAAGLPQLRRNLLAGLDSVADMPPARAEATGLDPAVPLSQMGHLDDIHTFDHRFFGLSKREATLVDPHQRIALALAYRAIEDAGYARDTLREHTTAVVFSAAISGYHEITGERGALSTLGNVPFGLPARVAHVLGLNGPCYAVDTGCNGSLIAVHHACRELAGGDADYALAGGISLRVLGNPAADAAGFTELVSSSGRCRAFDAAADGTVSGEGGAALLLTTLDRALAEGAPVHAVIRGSATLHNGHSSATISAPSATAQARVIAKAWAKAGADPARAGYLEAHGSGTRLGDAVELEGLAAAFAGRPGRLPIGSVKTNIGHLDHAAGIAGLVKTVLSVHHGELYPSLHFERPTGDISLADAGIEVVTSARPWAAGQGETRLAGVSSFSLGGVNAHVVVEQPPLPSPGPVQEEDRVRLVGVSARTRAALAELCTDLALALRDSDLGIADVAFTVNVGRTHYNHRIALLVKSTGDLALQLAAHATWLRADDEKTEVPQSPAVVLLLSPNAVPCVPQGRTLPAELPASGHVAEVLAGQIHVHDVLRRYGIEFHALLSSGTSRHAARYLLGTLSDVDSAEFGADEPVDGDRLLGVAKDLLADGPVLFLEPSPEGALGRLLADGLTGDHRAEVRFLGEATDGLLEAAGLVYERGADIDWAAVSGSGRRVRLPGHPLHGTPCWPATRRPAEVTPVVVPTETALTTTAPVVRPATPAEPETDGMGWLGETLRDLLHAETEIGPADDYFELGMNSIIAVQLADRIQARFGVRPKLIDLYDRPKVGQLADLIPVRDAGSGGLPPIRRHDGMVMSFGQERMWFHHQLDPDTTLYNLPMVTHIHGPIDVAALRGTWEDLADRHEVLRSNYVETDGTPALRIRPGLGDFFHFADVSGRPEPLAAARELVREAAGFRFDLARDPLVRVLVVRMAAEEHVVQVTMHHSVNDGGSPKIFQRELPELYAARRAGRPPQLDPLPVRYRDYAKWQRDLLASNALDHELEYWTEVLRDAPVLQLPLDHPRPARKAFTGELYPFTIPAQLLDELRRLGRRESVSLFVVLLSGLYRLLARHSGQDDIIVGTPTSGRNRPELDGMIGFFNSTVALRADLSGEPDATRLLRQVRSVVLEALEHQEIPFDRVVNALGRERDLSRAPLFDVFHVHQQLPPIQPIAEAEGGFFDPGDSPVNVFGGMPPGTAKFDLTLLTTDREGETDMAACLEYSTELFTGATAARLTADYLDILRDLAGLSPVRPIAVGPEVPTDRPRPSTPEYSTAVVSAPVDIAATDPEAAVLAAWVLALSWYSGQDEVVLGNALAHRPLRIDLADEPDFTTLCGRIRRELAAPSGNDSAEQRFLVTYTGTGAVPSGAELSLSWAPSGSDRLTLAVHYAPELFDESTVTAMLFDLRRLLGALTAQPGTPVFEVAMGHVHQDPGQVTEAPVGAGPIGGSHD